MFTKTEAYPSLFKLGAGGETREWFLEFGETAEGQGGYRSFSGIVDGTLTDSGWTHTQAMNVGRSSETNSVEQARAEITAHYEKKRKRGYFDSIEEIGNVPFTKPMLATDVAKVKGFDYKDAYTQPKLDGIRCLVMENGMWSRTGQRITTLPHIYNALAPYFAIDPDAVFDGELYNHDLKDDFNQITSLVRRETVTQDQAADAERLIQYHMYDMVSEEPFADRVDTLAKAWAQLGAPQQLQLVPTTTVSSKEDADKAYAAAAEAGYEGLMIRANVPYQHTRTKALLKRKEFDTDEFEVKEVLEGEGNWRGYAKKFVIKLKDGTTAGAGVRGTQADLAALLINPEKPTWATVRYFGMTPAGKPRFPVVIDYGTGKRND